MQCLEATAFGREEHHGHTWGGGGGGSAQLLAFLVLRIAGVCGVQCHLYMLLPSPPSSLACSLLMTTMCLEYQPSAVACVCIHLACHWKEIEVRSDVRVVV